MPVSVVKSDRDEHNWERAKQIAAEEGHEKDWKYIMGIYKRMNPNRFKNKEASFARELLRNTLMMTRYIYD